MKKTMMEKLDITEEEAKELIAFDKEVDRMTSLKNVNSDLTDEQKKASKTARKGSSTKREKPTDTDKADIISSIVAVLSTKTNDITVPNKEREILFTINNRKFKIILSVPRK